MNKALVKKIEKATHDAARLSASLMLATGFASERLGEEEQYWEEAENGLSEVLCEASIELYHLLEELDEETLEALRLANRYPADLGKGDLYLSHLDAVIGYANSFRLPVDSAMSIRDPDGTFIKKDGSHVSEGMKTFEGYIPEDYFGLPIADEEALQRLEDACSTAEFASQIASPERTWPESYIEHLRVMLAKEAQRATGAIPGWITRREEQDDLSHLPRKGSKAERVFELLREGLPHKIIAERLGIRPNTVSVYKNRYRDPMEEA